MSGLHLFSWDVREEIANDVIFRVTKFSSFWNTPGHHTSYMMLIGLNYEIIFMFMVIGIALP